MTDRAPEIPAAEPASASDPVLLHWTTQPARKRRFTAVLVALLIAVMVVIVYFLTFSVIFTVGAGIILFGSLTQFYFETTFTFTERGVRVKYIINKIEKPWSQYRSFYEDKHGVLLSPFVRPSRLENFRGLYIRFDNNRDEVMAIVKSKINMVKDPV